MNDIILSSLLNLFALFNTQNKVDKETTRKVLSNYLVHHFGVRDLDYSLEFYNDLLTFYGEMPDLDVEMFVNGICSKLHGKISVEEQILMLLRLMEIHRCGEQETTYGQAFRCVAECFDISNDTFNDLVAFVTEDFTASRHVRMMP